jgi:PEGA domain-containing protein
MKNLARVSLAFGAFALAASLLAGQTPRSAPQVRSGAPSRPSTVRMAPSSRPAQASPSHGSPRGGGWHRGGHGGRGYRWYPGYRPWRWGWGWGWGWGGYWGYGPGWYGGYYGAPYGYAPYGYGYATYAPGAWAAVDTDVSPDEAQVLLDGRFVGSADDFDGYPDYLYLKPGKYQLEFRLEGFEPQTVDVDARAGVKIDVGNKLKKIPGAKQYGSYDPPQPEGGVRRFWGKEKDGPPNAVDLDMDEGGYTDWRDRDSASDQPPPIDDPEARADAADAPVRPSNPDAPPPPRASGPGAATSARGRIVFRIAPDDAAVYVDDRFAGTAEELSSLSRGLQVPAGTHRVVVSRPGYGSESLQVEVQAGRSETVELTLDRPEGS